MKAQKKYNQKEERTYYKLQNDNPCHFIKVVKNILKKTFIILFRENLKFQFNLFL